MLTGRVTLWDDAETNALRLAHNFLASISTTPRRPNYTPTPTPKPTTHAPHHQHARDLLLLRASHAAADASPIATRSRAASEPLSHADAAASGGDALDDDDTRALRFLGRIRLVPPPPPAAPEEAAARERAAQGLGASPSETCSSSAVASASAASGGAATAKPAIEDTPIAASRASRAGWAVDHDSPRRPTHQQRLLDGRSLAAALSAEQPTEGPLSTRMLMVPSAMAVPCVACVVLRFQRGDEERLRARGRDTRHFVSQLVAMRRQRQQRHVRGEPVPPRQPTSPPLPSAAGLHDLGGCGTLNDAAAAATAAASPATPLKRKGESYGFLLHTDLATGGEDDAAYDPYEVDDPALQSGKHRMVMNLPGFVESVVPYVKPHDLKAQLNEQWALLHENISRSLTLSKIRAAKRDLAAVALEADAEIATVALAHVYYERLVLRGVVNKPNRKLIAAVSLLLAAKWNEPKVVRALLQGIERALGIPRAVVCRSEFSVYVELGFALRVEPAHVHSHFVRLLQSVEKSPHEYLGGWTAGSGPGWWEGPGEALIDEGCGASGVQLVEGG